MKKFIIKYISDNIYTLIDKDNYEQKVNLEFYDLDNLPKVGNIIFLSDEYLKEGITLRYGALNNGYGIKITNSCDKDLLILVTDNEKIYLKRLYG